MSTLKAISIDEIRKKAQGTIIMIPDWENGKEIAVRVRAIDMTPHVLKLKDMPNNLKNSAYEVFNGSQKNVKKAQEKLAEETSIESMQAMMPVVEGIVSEALVEPTYQEISEIYPMTLPQKMAIFNHVMGGMEKLDSFR